MKSKGILILSFLFIGHFLMALAVSFWGLFTDSYFKDYNNYKSLKKPQSYMEIDTFLFQREYHTDLDYGSSDTYNVYGILQSNKSSVKMVLGNQKYFDYNLDKHPVYKSKLTGDFFLKNAPDGYYKRKYRSFLISMYLKFSFLPLFAITIYIIKKYRYSI